MCIQWTKTHKKLAQTIYQTLGVQSISIGNLICFVDVKSQSESKGLWLYQQQHFKRKLKTISNRINRNNNDIDNLQEQQLKR